jgi:hypothetical protein
MVDVYYLRSLRVGDLVNTVVYFVVKDLFAVVFSRHVDVEVLESTEYIPWT